MEAINRAIEDASDFQGFMKKLENRSGAQEQLQPYVQEGSAKQPFENREQYRARIKAERRSKAKA